METVRTHYLRRGRPRDTESRVGFRNIISVQTSRFLFHNPNLTAATVYGTVKLPLEEGYECDSLFAVSLKFLLLIALYS